MYASLSVCYKPWCKTPKPAKAVETISGELLDEDDTGVVTGEGAAAGDAHHKSPPSLCLYVCARGRVCVMP